MKLKRTLQFLLLFCVAFLWTPMTVQAAEPKPYEVDNKDDFIEAITNTAQAGDTVKLTKSFEILADGSSTYEAKSGITIDGGGNTLILQKQIGLTDSTIINMTVSTSGSGYFTTMGKCKIAGVNFIGTGKAPLGNGRITEKGERIPGILTLKDVSFSGNGDAIQNNDKSIINYEDGTINVDDIGIVNNFTGVVNMKDVIFTRDDEKEPWGNKAIENMGTFNMSGGSIKHFRYGVYNVKKGQFNMSGVTFTGRGSDKYNHVGVTNSDEAVFNISSGSITGFECGILNDATINMIGGTITANNFGIRNSDTMNMTGGDISSNNVGVANPGIFTMEGGKITGNSKRQDSGEEVVKDVKNSGTFIRTKVTEVGEVELLGNGKYEVVDFIPKQESTDEVVITDSEGNIVKEPERWVPTTPDEIKRYAFLGKEAVSYNCPKTNPYELKILNAMQGPKCFVSFEAALGDYTMGRTYNIYPDGKQAYSKDQKASISLSIPMELQKEGRTFKMICVTEGGLPILLNDLDKNPETITFETDKFYAFALIYK